MATNVDGIHHHIVEKFGSRQMRTLERKELQEFLDSKADWTKETERILTEPPQFSQGFRDG